jgi:hypothetical protein
MKKAQYSMMSRGRTSGVFGSSTVLLSGRGSLSLRPGGSRSFLGEGSDLVIAEILWNGKGPTSPH